MSRIRNREANVEKAYERMYYIGAICFIVGMFLGSAAGCVH